ncbi:hypothetical protein GH714_041582 [Hevea brasiliensis]|uniref:Pentacotripeptide-repeat region of PRORP domain-containing protein n=1 Tax=Hevea brasiliensis TaxID=3981 RepID=A0A6A6MR25_HEVBR|nr:hypothetical protein GH714_041582 [Hevea brasiliensis]
MNPTLLPKHVAFVLKYQKDPLKALVMFNSVKKEDGFKHTLLTYWCMIEKLGFHSEFEAIENVVMEIRMNVDNSLLEGVSIVAMRKYGRKGKVHNAVDVFERMDLHNYEPSVLSSNAIMNILVKKGALDGAINLLDSVNGEGLSPDVVTYNTLIYGLCKNSKVVEAVNYLHKMLNKGLEPDGFTYNPIIDGYCKIDMTQEADKILNDAIFKGFVPDEFTHCSLINGYSRTVT